MSTSLLFSLIGIHLLALMVPGPDFFLMLRTSLVYGWQGTLRTACGVTLGVIIWATLAVLGISVVLMQFKALHTGLMVFAVLYLLYLGIILLKSALQKRRVQQQNAPATPKMPSMRRLFWLGFLTNFSNPKAILYFASIFAALLAKTSSPYVAWEMLAVVAVESLIYFLAVGKLFSHHRVQQTFLAKQRYVDGLCGIVFLGFAGGIFWEFFGRYL